MTAPAEQAGPARQRLSAESRRAAIIDAARTLFASNGFRGTGTSDIAAAAGCSEPVIYKHFASKQALFAAVLEDCAGFMRARFAAAADGEGDLFDAYLRFVRGHAGDPRVAELSRLRYLAVTLSDEPEIRAGLQAMVAHWQAGVRVAVEVAQANGRIRADVDVRVGLDAVLRPRPGRRVHERDRGHAGARAVPAPLRRARRASHTDPGGTG